VDTKISGCELGQPFADRLGNATSLYQFRHIGMHGAEDARPPAETQGIPDEIRMFHQAMP
jgi:hypothetical protein